MEIYNAITYFYANEVNARNELPDYAYCGPSWKWSNKTL
jgi:hypothetical protein